MEENPLVKKTEFQIFDLVFLQRDFLEYFERSDWQKKNVEINLTRKSDNARQSWRPEIKALLDLEFV